MTTRADPFSVGNTDIKSGVSGTDCRSVKKPRSFDSGALMAISSAHGGFAICRRPAPLGRDCRYRTWQPVQRGNAWPEWALPDPQR